ncbi:tyrosine-type recombinase/integrase [Paenibacillus glacialis]|uniref:Tyr recombinase domain-containing protein n=1 Tax=Paenibacillus glacialis TaxID=494026 RepID=A0A168C2U5_9BACL|nr:tyrosine-type recombinase/integrase [Paenibacillus glacialis]OAB32996.1 hypothetical protein PGLA_26315 [Paenibacillus glacialis]
MSIIQSKSKLQLAREEIQLAISQYGINTFEQVMVEIGLTNLQENPVIEEDVSLQEAGDYFIECETYQYYSTSSKKTYRSELSQYQRFVSSQYGCNQPSLKQSADRQIIMKYLSRYKGSNTMVKKKAFLRSFLRVTLGHYFHQSLDDYKNTLRLRPEAEDEEPKAFRKIQLAELLNLAQLSNHGFRNHAIVWVFMGSGIRLSELCKLQICDVLPTTQQIKIYPKMKEYQKEKRTISSLALLILTDYIEFTYSYCRQTLSLEEYRNLYIFSKDFGKTHLQPRAIQYIVKDLINKAKSIENKNLFCVHSFRHSFALYALESGVDIYMISKLLGHKSIETTDEYLKLFDYQLREVIDKNPIAMEEMKKLQQRMNTLCQESY